ncbi:hypothetical protein COCVIDRAFT_28181 [Bipolaris victoriae FI3]|uniref:Uncharacterized protein n=1 Tax=Bipolaris victoriae (strain FI3) TaxID=930091 RepID=W7EAH1_BIPV3|nr:hypothetical protein COCVIDRAFT_28181 [Bipolaris victoriae FI3]
MELSDFDTTVSNLNVYQGDTIEDVMNIPFTTVVDTSIQDFGTLYPHDQAELSEDEQMSKYRRLMEEKLRAQVSAQEIESKSVATAEAAELYPAQDSYQDGGSDVKATHDPSAAQEPSNANANKPSPPTPPLSHTRRASEPILSPSTSSTIDTPFSAPYTTPSSPTPSPPPPSKNRRNTNPRKTDHQRPHYKVEEEEALVDLEQYRTMDLAPLEPIMQSSTAGDLITHGTPIKVRDVDIFLSG